MSRSQPVGTSTRSSASISDRGLVAVFFFTMFSFATVDGPMWMARVAGHHGWVPVAVGAALTVPPILAMIDLAARFPGTTVFQYSVHLLGRPLALAANGLFIVYGCLFASYVFRQFSDLVQTYLLPTTPAWAIVTLVASGMVMVLALGPLPLSRVAQFLAVPAGLAALILMGIALRNVNLIYLAPVWPVPAGAVIAGAGTGVFPFIPVKNLLVQLALARQPRRLRRPLLVTHAAVAVFKVLVTVAAIGIFGDRGTQRLAWPTLEILRVGQAPLALLEELGLPGLMVYQVALFVSSAVYFVTLYTGIPSWLGLGPGVMPALLPVLGVVVGGIALLVQDRTQLDLLRGVVHYGGYYAGAGYPLLLWLAARLRGAGGPPR